MKHLFRTRFAAAILLTLSAFTWVSCDKDDDTPQQETITEVVVNNASFTILEAAVIRAGLADTLANTPNLTVFAPTDEAFTKAGLTLAAINSTPVDALKNILKYHVLTSKVVSTAVPAGPNAEVTAFNGGKLFVTRNSAGVFVNGVKVTTADVSAANGVIHIVDRVILPAAGNIVQVAQANSNFTYLVAAVLRADASGTSISGALTGAGPLTVFAPTNQAFIDAGFPTIASINAADPNTLKNILLYHVISARVFSSDLSEGAQPATAQGAKVTITLSGGAKVKGTTNTTASTITATDLMATNGVIHVIDKVLLP